MKPGDIVVAKQRDILGAMNRKGDMFKLVVKQGKDWYATEVQGFKYPHNMSSMEYSRSVVEDGERKYYYCFIFPEHTIELHRKEELLTE